MMVNASRVTQQDNAPKTILVVEDEPLLRLVVSELLRMRKLTVVETASAEEAEAVLAAGVHVDLVFTDVRMPGRFDGMELTRRVRARNPQLPVVVTSGHLDGSGVMDGVSFLRKPYLPSGAVTLISALLSSEETDDI
ncbi:MAG: hypothetical protein B7X99_02175 [Rhizobiales bacterium 17-65-6]|nr:MAG: hypothetical protein B7Y70_07600 [Rhizobiales bacterium 35-68-8]OZA01014.1 MAG: hypothetical protein B7X99_02175 [Rhizobiales bacterium 17-65-6]